MVQLSISLQPIISKFGDENWLPLDYAHNSVGQEFRQGRVGMARLCYAKLEASVGVT